MNVSRRKVQLVLCAISLGWWLLPGMLTAFGGYTHQALGLRILEELARYDEGAKTVLDNRSLREAFLGGTVAPDLSQDFLHGKKQAHLHRLFHSPEFVSALLEQARQDKRDYAMALGWKAHVLADDEGAHGPNGYANQKKLFSRADLRGTNHGVTEALLDIISLSAGGPRAPALVPNAAIARRQRMRPTADRRCGSHHGKDLSPGRQSHGSGLPRHR